MGYLFGGPYNKDHNKLGSILVSLYFGKLPFCVTEGQIACRAASTGKQRCCIRSISEAKNVLTEFRLGSAAAPLDNFGRDAGQNPFDASSCCSGFIEYGKGLGARCNDPNNLEVV